MKHLLIGFLCLSSSIAFSFPKKVLPISNTLDIPRLENIWSVQIKTLDYGQIARIYTVGPQNPALSKKLRIFVNLLDFSSDDEITSFTFDTGIELEALEKVDLNKEHDVIIIQGIREIRRSPTTGLNEPIPLDHEIQLSFDQEGQLLGELSLK